MVGRDEQLRRIGERRVRRKPARVGVAMRADDRQVLHAGVEIAGSGARLRLRRKKQVRIGQRDHGKNSSFQVVISVRSGRIDVNVYAETGTLRQPGTGVTQPAIRKNGDSVRLMTSSHLSGQHAAIAVQGRHTPGI